MKKSAFNWGHGIAVFYVVFVVIVITALFASFGVDHSLVVDDYYTQDLSYQSHFNKQQNFLMAGNDALKLGQKDQNLTIDIHGARVEKGVIQWYRPSNKSLDFTSHLSGSTTTIDTSEKAKGRWVLKIEWTQEGQPYYTEKEIYLN